MKPLRSLKFSSKNLCLTWLRKNLAGHTQAEGCPPSFLKALDRGLFADRRLSVLEVQMQVSPMHVIGLGPHNRGEYLAATVMCET